MGKYSYRIDINGGTSSGEKFTYSFGATKNILINVAKQKVTVSYKMTILKDIHEFLDMTEYKFRDALRKAYLLHMLVKDQGLIVKTMDITIGKKKYSFDENTPNFPFVYSMISEGPLDLTDAWKSEKVLNYYLQNTKTKVDTALCNCALLAFISGKSRTFRNDRFLNFWTAMNSYYNCVGESFEAAYKKKYGDNKYSLNHNDNLCMGALVVRDIKKDFIMRTRKQKLDEFNALVDSTNKKLYTYTNGDADDLYNDSLAHLDNKVSEDNPYYSLYEAAKTIDTPLFVYLLLLYPYQLRCNYFHGSKVQPILSGYRDPEIFDLNIVNRFLERFLTEKIPTMFENQKMVDGKLIMDEEVLTIDDETLENIKYYLDNRGSKK